MNETQNQSQLLSLAPQSAETGNSRLRAIFKNPLETAADVVTDAYPGVTASHITAAGTLACLAAATTAARAPETARTVSWLHLAGSLSDALDGPVARAAAARNGRSTTSGGALFDTVSDRLQEFGASYAQAEVAFGRGDRTAGLLGLAFAATSTLPSLARSHAEANGIVVAEGLLGSRHTRVTLNCLGYFWNQHPNRVRLMALTGTALNLYNAGSRLSALKPGSRHNKGDLNATKQAEAHTRRRVLGLVSASIVVASAVKARRAKSV